MAEIKDKHPSWFKMKIERRELIRQLPPETAVNVLLACWDYLETEEKPHDLSPIESIAFATFIPDMEEAWRRYVQRIEARNSSREKSVDIGRSRSISTETEEETETEPEIETETDSKKECKADKPPAHTRPSSSSPTQQATDGRPPDDRRTTAGREDGEESDAAASTPAPKSSRAEKPARKKHGQYGWVLLTDEEFSRLTADLGEAELKRCIEYVDESAQSNGNRNRWRDWNLVIRKCSRDRWGLNRGGKDGNNGKIADAGEHHGKAEKKWDINVTEL